MVSTNKRSYKQIIDNIVHLHYLDAEKTTIGSASSRTGDMNENKREPHSIVGITLLLGFVMMLIIDQLSSGISNTHYNQLPINGLLVIHKSCEERKYNVYIFIKQYQMMLKMVTNILVVSIHENPIPVSQQRLD